MAKDPALGCEVVLQPPRVLSRLLWCTPFAALVIALVVMAFVLSLGVYDEPKAPRHSFLDIIFSIIAFEISYLVARLLGGVLLAAIAWLLGDWPLGQRFVVLAGAGVGVGALLVWWVSPLVGWLEPGVHFTTLYVGLVLGLLWLVASRSGREGVADE